MSARLRGVSGLSFTLALIAVSGCGGGETTTATSNTGGTTTGTGATGGGGTGGTGTGGTTPQPYNPEGCSFQVSPRPEYLDWSIGKTDTLATPNIRRVRL